MLALWPLGLSTRSQAIAPVAFGVGVIGIKQPSHQRPIIAERFHQKRASDLLLTEIANAV